MSGYPILPATVSDRISSLEAEVTRLERGQNVAQTVVSGAYTQGMRIYGNGLQAEKNYSDWVELSGSTVSLKLTWLNSFVLTAGEYIDWQFLYYQEVPQLYSQAQIGAGTNYTLLGNGIEYITVTGFPETDLTISAAIPEALVGTYGQVIVGFDGYTTAFSMNVFVQPYTGLIFSN